MVDIHDSVGAAKQQANPQLALEEAVKAALARIKHKFVVMSGKGGVGKTSTSVNLAMALAGQGAKVGLVDVDLHGPDVPRMLGFSGVLDVDAEKRIIPLRYNDNLSAVSVESLIAGKDSAIIWRGPVKHSVIQQFIGLVNWGDLDYLVIDAPPGTGDEPLTVAQSINDARAIIVTTPQEVSLADVRKSINFCQKVNMAIFGIVENMSGFTCPHCNEMVDLFGVGGGERTASAMGLPFLGRIPFDPRIVACGDAGISFQEKYPDTPVAKAYAAIAEKVMAG
ncbi:Mrp/NBP35 family ATP-binding protein [Desulfatitalea alkaliphila]|uniref:Iron-sulfur cluster carrier protein n=1 Tax=Desulfatitalea alkaliphila TaxID=2929485 RepID=A0AA41R4D4_9BACT|nr:Mrp/NBP35 family ATP-binding protein [Desulfatitalea alkaliphila]MCJ8501727.1 Mrp/NBP35 family ATP-binding protein [Desulfatitalea alkaliphila]